MRRFMLAAAVLASGWGLAAQRVDFALMSDLHVAAGSHSVEDLRQCILDVNSLQGSDGAPSFVLVTGDLTDFGSDEQITLVRSMLDSLSVPYYAIPGNHDAKWSESGCNTFGRVFDGEDFEFVAGGFRFVGCASGPDMRMTPALIPRQHMKRLEELSAGPSCPTIFVNHYPLDSSVLNYGDVRVRLREMDTRIVFSGHWHTNRVMDYDGIPGLIFRSTLESRNAEPGYNLLSLENGVLTVRERLPRASRTMAPWFSTTLDKLEPSSQDYVDGLPEDYPWMRYDVNGRYSQVKEVWRVAEDSNIASGFALCRRGRACYVTETGLLRCIDVRDGSPVWSRQLPGKVFSTPLYAAGRIFVGCADGGMYAFSARSGRLLWSAMAGKSVLASPVRLGHKVFFGASDGVFRALNLRTGRLLWSFDGVDSFVESRPYVDREQIVFGSWGKKLYSLDPRNGHLQWVWEINRGSVMYSPAACWPVKSADRIFIAAPDRKTYVLDAGTGEQQAVLDGGRETVGLSEDGRTVYVKTMHSRAYAFDAGAAVDTCGTLPKKWDVRTCLGYDISPTALVEHEGCLIIPTDKGNVVALDAADGSLVWAHKISPALVNPITFVSHERFLASTLDGVVVMLSVY